MPRVDDPYRNFRYKVEINGQEYGFSEVSGFDATIDAIDYREGNHPTHVRKLPGLTKYGNVTLKWGVTDTMDLYQWHLNAVNGNIERRTVAIQLLDEAGDPKARWEIAEAWPTKYDPMDLNAKGNDVSIETLELVHEGVVRVQ